VSSSLDIPPALALGLVGAAVVAFVAYRAAAAAPAAAAAVGRAIDPTSDQNVFYRGAGAVVGVVTGSQDETLGGWLYDLTHADPMAPAPAPQTGGASGHW